MDNREMKMMKTKIEQLNESLERANQEKQELLEVNNGLREHVNEVETNLHIEQTRNQMLNSQIIQIDKVNASNEKRKVRSTAEFSKELENLLDTSGNDKKDKEKDLELAIVLDKQKMKSLEGENNQLKMKIKELESTNRTNNITNNHSLSIESSEKSQIDTNMKIMSLQSQKESLEQENLELHRNLDEAIEKIFNLESQYTKNMMQPSDMEQWVRLEEIIRNYGFDIEEGPLM